MFSKTEAVSNINYVPRMKMEAIEIYKHENNINRKKEALYTQHMATSNKP